MTDRIEAIRARQKAYTVMEFPKELQGDVAWLLSVLEEVRDALRFDSGLWDEDARGEAVEALERAMGTAWLYGRAEEHAALAPVAPDAEPTEWEWSDDDVVQDVDGHVLARIIHSGTYPWRSTNGSDQRDQDITDLVTKHGGRVLVCKARGIGAGGASC